MSPAALIEREYPNLTKSEQKLADYILHDPRCVLDKPSIADVARAAHSSSAALVRLCQKLGYKGYAEFKYSMHRYLMAQGAENSAAAPEGESADPMHNIIETYVRYLRQLPGAIDPEALRRAARTICEARRISIWGANRTYQSARQLSHRLGRLGIFNQVTDDWVVLTDNADILTTGDLCVLFSVMGRGLRGREGVVRSLHERGCMVLLITMNPRQPAAEYADQVFTLPCISHDSSKNFFEDQIIVYTFLELLLYEVAKIYPG